MISKDCFVHIIDRMKEEEETYYKIGQLVGSVENLYDNSLSSEVVELLEDIFYCAEEEIISHWAWGCDYGKTHKIKTAEELYEYLLDRIAGIV